MSLKAIKTMLDDVRQGALPSQDEIATVQKEIDALEKAAMDLRRGMHGRGWDESGVHEGFELLERIAKEAK